MKTYILASLEQTRIKIGETSFEFAMPEDVNTYIAMRAIIFSVLRVLNEHEDLEIVIPRVSGQLNMCIWEGITETLTYRAPHIGAKVGNFNEKWEELLRDY